MFVDMKGKEILWNEKKEKGISVFARYVFVMYIVKRTKKQRGNRTKTAKKTMEKWNSTNNLMFVDILINFNLLL